MKRKTPKRKLTYNELRDLLSRSSWSYKDVMAYCQVEKSKAFEIIKICKDKLNGKILFNEHSVSRNSVLAYAGSSIEQERYVLKQLENTQT